MNNFLESEMYILNKKSLLNLYKLKKKNDTEFTNIFLMIMIGLEENVSLNMSPKMCFPNLIDYADRSKMNHNVVITFISETG